MSDNDSKIKVESDGHTEVHACASLKRCKCGEIHQDLILATDSIAVTYEAMRQHDENMRARGADLLRAKGQSYQGAALVSMKVLKIKRDESVEELDAKVRRTLEQMRDEGEVLHAEATSSENGMAEVMRKKQAIDALKSVNTDESLN